MAYNHSGLIYTTILDMHPPGHNAWVIGNEPVVGIDFTGLKDYAKKVRN